MSRVHITAAGSILGAVAVLSSVSAGIFTSAAPSVAATPSPLYKLIGPTGTGTEKTVTFPGAAVNRKQWAVYTGSDGAGKPRRSTSAVTVSAGTLNITDSASAVGGVCYCTTGEPQLYGHWEIRARTEVGTGYSPVILLWPKGTTGPATNEVDLAEFPDGARNEMYTTVHYGNKQVRQESAGQFAAWHTYGVDWGPDHLSFLVDGKVLWTVTNQAEIPHVPMFLGLQEDIGPVRNWTPSVSASTARSVSFQISSVKVWSKPALP